MKASLTLIASLFLNQYRDILITYVTCPTSKAGMGGHHQLLAALLYQPRKFRPASYLCSCLHCQDFSQAMA